MKRSVIVLLLCLFTSGCLSAQITPNANTLARIQTITIVPVEDRPLILQPQSTDDRKAMDALMQSATRPASSIAPSASGVGATMAGSAAPLILAPNADIRTGASLLAIIGGTAMLIEASSAGKEIHGETASIERSWPSHWWMPSVEFSNKAVDALQQAGFAHARLIDGCLRLPISDRSITWHMENWQGPLRRWYSSEVSAVDYTAVDIGSTDALLEVGLLNYECTMGKLMLQVFVRLIDPRTKQVLGRAKAYSFPNTGPMTALLQNDGEGIKRLILETGNPLTVRCLRELGLLHK